MSKVLLVEDDNNLREIFEMRLKAEGYDTITASNGEEALVVAMKEKPDLIIADVMMPKLSGFEMLETLRAAPEMANTKTIMMTALGQAEDRARGERLGVIKYLVKSQVTLEDFVRVVREVVSPDGSTPPGSAADPASQASPSAVLQNNLESEQSMQEDNTQSQPAPAQDAGADQTNMANPVAGSSDIGATPDQTTTAEEQTAVQGQIDNFVSDAPTDGSNPMASGPTDGGTTSYAQDASEDPTSATPTPGSSADASGGPTVTADAGTDTSAQPDIPVSTPPADGSPTPPAESAEGGQPPASSGL